MMCQKFLSSGEFARLCRTTKATLFHYDQLGLLKPRYLTSNGYRRYGAEQFFDFDTITAFKDAGSSLEEISHLRDNLDEAALIHWLEEKRRILRDERRRLAQRDIMLRDMLEGLHEANALNFDTCLVEKQQEENLEIIPTEADSNNIPMDLIARSAAYITHMENGKKRPRTPFGFILDKEVLFGASYNELYYFSRARRHTLDTVKLHKKEGNYLVCAHRGDYNSHLDCLQKIYQWIVTNKITVDGYLYVYDMISCLGQNTSDIYTVKYCIEVIES